jgi:hypothetical protein
LQLAAQAPNLRRVEWHEHDEFYELVAGRVSANGRMLFEVDFRNN